MATHKAFLQIRDKPVGQVVILTDSLTVPQRIQANVKDALKHELSMSIQELMLSVPRVTLQWIPAHCRVCGNEVTNALAKSGGRLEQMEQPASYLESKTLIDAAQRKVWEAQDPCCSHSIDQMHKPAKKAPKGNLQAQDRPCCLQDTFYSKSTKRTLPSFAEQTIEQDCPNLEATRRNTRPTLNSLQEKLWGSLTSLAQTSSFLEDGEILTLLGMQMKKNNMPYRIIFVNGIYYKDNR